MGGTTAIAASDALLADAFAMSAAEPAVWGADLTVGAGRAERLQPGLIVVTRATLTVAEP